MCNCGCEHKIMSEFGSITDFDVVYTGETITCGDDVIIEQGHTIRDSLDAIARVLCDKSDQSDLDELQVKVSDVEDVANGADTKAQQALDEIDNIDMDVTPADVGVTLGNRVPLSLNGDSWQSGGLLMSQDIIASTGAVRYTGGRLRVGDAVEGEDAVNKGLLDAATSPDNTGVTSITNAEQSKIEKSHQSSIDGGVYNSERNLILGSSFSRILPGANEMGVFLSHNSVIDMTEGSVGGSFIFGSQHCTLEGVTSMTSIISSDYCSMEGGPRISIIASRDCRIGRKRQQTAIIASSNARIEDWTSASSSKWNSAVIASHGGVIQSSNSYTLVTGKRTQSNSSAQLVCGQSNIIEPSRSVEDPLKKNFIVGNGTGDVNNPSYPGERSNAFYVLQNGTAWVQKSIEVDSPGDGVILKSPNGTRFLLTVGDDGSLGTTEI